MHAMPVLMDEKLERIAQAKDLKPEEGISNHREADNVDVGQDDSDDDVVLSPEAMTALREFYEEQGDEKVEENWQLSQFWYTDDTAKTLASLARSQGTRVCCLSSPTAFRQLHSTRLPGEKLTLLEFDRRFGDLYGDDFIYYDYNSPEKIPRELERAFDVVIADPPFLAEECLEKVAKSIRFLTDKKIILCTGMVMKPLAEKLLGLSETSFEPQHARKLGNRFGCFTNFDINKL